MQEIGAVLNTMITYKAEAKKSAEPALEGSSFLSALCPAGVASQAAVTEKGKLKEMSLQKKQRAEISLLENQEEEENIFEVISHLGELLQKIEDYESDQRPSR